jgi:two-component system, OmpR family, response regulator ChvI
MEEGHTDKKPGSAQPASRNEPGAGEVTPKRPDTGRLLLVDDDEHFLEALAANLEDEGFNPVCYADSMAALDWLLEGGQCDAILLDWYMPDVPGLAFLKQLRDAGIGTPAIVFTAVNKDVIEDTALASGAIDFVDKSRRFSVLLKRLRLVLDGAKGADSPMPLEEISIGELVLLPKCLRARWMTQEVALTVVEYRIVEKLSSRPGMDFTYREIYDVVHGEGFWAGDGDDGFRVNVRSLIKRIRQKFRDIDPEFESIENYPGYGYRWRGEPQGASGSPGRASREDDTTPIRNRIDSRHGEDEAFHDAR